MTTIAWDGKTLAVDRGAWFGHIENKTTKLHRIDRLTGWYAMCGGSGVCQRVLRWLQTGERVEIPAADHDNTLGIFVNDKGQTFMVSGLLEMEPMESIPMANGAGREFVMGAMCAGKTAIEALRLAEQWTDCCIGCDYVEIIK